MNCVAPGITVRVRARVGVGFQLESGMDCVVPAIRVRLRARIRIMASARVTARARARARNETAWHRRPPPARSIATSPRP